MRKLGNRKFLEDPGAFGTTCRNPCPHISKRNVISLVYACIDMISILSAREFVIKKLFSAVWFVENKGI